MKKILFAFFLPIAGCLLPILSFSQANTYWHDRIDTTIYATTTNVGNAYTGTNLNTNFNVARYNRGLLVSTFFVTGNTGAATYRLVTASGTLSSAAIRKAGGSALSSGDIPDSSAVFLLYYGSFWRLVGVHSASAAFWSLTGNTGTTPGTNFIGTTDAVDFVIKTNNTEKARMSSAGVFSLGLASTNNGSLLFSNSTNANTLTINSGVTSASHSWTLPLAQGGANTFLSNNGSGTLSWVAGSSVAWMLTGNAGTVDGTNFIGTTDNIPLTFRVNNQKSGRIDNTLRNTYWGFQAGNSITTGSSNTAIGNTALASNIAGSANVAIGRDAGYNTTRSLNVFVGDSAGVANTTGTSNTFIGYLANAGSGNLTNATAIGANAVVGASNALVLGSLANVGIGASSPRSLLNIVGTTTNAYLWCQDNVTGSGALDGFQVGTFGGTYGGFLWNFENLPMAFACNNAEAMRIAANGNVGIGTLGVTTTTTLLDVAGAGGALNLVNTTNSGNADFYIASRTAAGVQKYFNIRGNEDAETLYFIHNSLTTTDFLFSITADRKFQLAENSSIALDPAASADGKYTGTTIAGTAGTALAFGDVVYLAAADSRWELADADAASTAGDVLVGMCVLVAVADGSPTTILLNGTVRADASFPSFTISAPVFISTTAGDVTQTAPAGTADVVRRLGFALTADEMYFNPSNDYVTIP